MAKAVMNNDQLEEILRAFAEAGSLPSSSLKKLLAELSGKLEGSIENRLEELSGQGGTMPVPPTMG